MIHLRLSEYIPGSISNVESRGGPWFEPSFITRIQFGGNFKLQLKMLRSISRFEVVYKNGIYTYQTLRIFARCEEVDELFPVTTKLLINEFEKCLCESTAKLFWLQMSIDHHLRVKLSAIPKLRNYADSGETLNYRLIQMCILESVRPLNFSSVKWSDLLASLGSVQGPALHIVEFLFSPFASQ